MRGGLTALVFALSSAVLLFGAGQADAQRPVTYVLRSPVVSVFSLSAGGAQVLCNGSDLATGGGHLTSVPGESETHILADTPISDASGAPTLNGAAPRGWRVDVYNPAFFDITLETFVACLTTASDLTVNAAGTGSGTVSSSDGSINCPTTCAATYLGGSTVTLTASPGAGSIFGGWTGCDAVADTTCTVTMTAARSVTATFNVQRFTLTVNTAGTGSGTVSSSDGSISSCAGTCTATYDSGASVTLTASPDTGSLFGDWSGCDTVADTTCTVTMSAERSAMATFNVQP
jgi:hypothetical protein